MTKVDIFGGRGGVFLLVHNARLQFTSERKLRQKELGTAGHITSTLSNRKK